MRELSAAFAKADRDVRLGWRHELRDVAEPVRRDAEALAKEQIPRIGKRWARMRTGVTRKIVYVAPREKGNRRTGPVSEARRRADKKFAGLLMDRAMEPALEAHEAEIEQRIDHALDVMADDFNHGGMPL